MTAEEAMRYFLAHPKEFESCILCGGPSEYIGMFFPNDSEKFGGLADKQRIFGYGICGDCKQEPHSQDYVEKVIFKRQKDIRGIT
jgi:hypothetical protein